MAKKTKKEEVVSDESIMVQTPPKKEKTLSANTWEVKDRIYILNGPNSPLTYKIPSRHTTRHALLWYDKEKK